MSPADEIRMLAAEMERLHPRLFHTVPPADFERAVDELCGEARRLSREGLLLGVMRLAALPGPRDGHTGLHLLDGDHTQPFHLFPLRLWSFPEGFVVVAAAAPGLVGARLRSIDGTRIDDVIRRVERYVARDNDSSLAVRLPEVLVAAEVLHGVGVTAEQGRASFELDAGDVRKELLEASPAPRFVEEVGHPRTLPPAPGRTPLWLSAPNHSVRLLGDGAVYAVYARTRRPDDGFLAELRARAAGEGVRRVILDLRRNGGGDNTTYGPLVDALSDPRVDRPGVLVVLVGRMTYSAAGNLAAELQRTTGARFVGEPTGGSPHNFGDTVPIALPMLGVTVRVATLFHTPGRARDDRLTVEADVPVPLTADDWLAGRDPVLTAALELRPDAPGRSRVPAPRGERRPRR